MTGRRPPRTPFARHWTLDPEVVFLNHGSFGAAPRPVLEAQDRFRARMEREPVLFLGREIEGLLDAAREEVARFVGARPEDLSFVPNATAGVNTVLRALSFEPGDELLVTDHEYNASRNALDFVAERSGARAVVAPVPFPLASEDRIVDALLERVSPRTRLALVDHVTSPTGLVFPIERIVRALEERGVDVLVDGAHAPGMLPLDLDRLGAAYYTGNLHKWVCAPKGSALLHVRRDRQDRIVPLALSHGANAPLEGRSRFRRLFDWTGTDDPSAWLAVPEAIRFLGGLLPGGWEDLRARNRALALAGRARLVAALGIDPPSPASAIGSLAAVPLPDGAPGGRTGPYAVDPLQERLFARYGIEVPVMRWPAHPRRLIRISAQIYNDEAEMAYLAEALGDALVSS